MHQMDILPFMSLLTNTLMIILTIHSNCSVAIDTIDTTLTIRDGETLVSSGGTFELGFFSPGNSRNRYVGMWYKNVPVRKQIWVANRDNPLKNSTSGVLKVIQPGLLILVDETNGTTIWSTNTSKTVRNPIAQLLDSGNLVIRDANDDKPDNYLWQRFDFPTNTFLPGMKFGMNFLTGVETTMLSWKSDDDPSPGDVSFHLDPTGYPQLVIRRSTDVIFRMGPWNGLYFSGSRNESDEPSYKLTFVMDEKELYYVTDVIDKSFVSIIVLNQTGVAQRWTWANRSQEWVMEIDLPLDNCDKYNWCGTHGVCNMGDSPICRCLDRFVAKDEQGWAGKNWSGGCVRRSNLSCGGDVFLKYSGIKLPDSRFTRYDNILTLDECEDKCLKDCSCMAYTRLDISKGGSGCLMWFGELSDIKELSRGGQDIHIRMAASESENVADSKGKKLEIVLIASLTSAIGAVLIGLGLFLYTRKRKNGLNITKAGMYNGPREKDSELPMFDLSIILKATNQFSMDNKLGEGGFGPVYKGTLREGQEIAVKRLSKDSMQGLDEFKNEIVCIAKLQHRNLVRLLGGCVQGEEKMLVYEYMPNKSLDVILFDEKRSMLLDWKTRFQIVNGIARGIMYLHQDCPLRIIHRDLKASNILLDSEMNPKISDFGMARCFGGNDTKARTRRIVGTYGYMSPEYAVDGVFSVKSDVFSFGVIVLEIVIGKRNREFYHTDHNLNLLGHAWTLHKRGRSLELVDASLCDSIYFSEILRSIHVGLLCVQQNPEERPTMSSVVLMLGNDGSLPQPNRPGFFTEREIIPSSHNSSSTANSTNEVSITMLQAR